MTAPTGIGLVGFGALAAIELDQAVAGVRTAWTGEYQTSYIAEGISNVTGINAEYADVGLGFAGVTTSVVAGGINSLYAGLAAERLLMPQRVLGVRSSPR